MPKNTPAPSHSDISPDWLQLPLNTEVSGEDFADILETLDNHDVDWVLEPTGVSTIEGFPVLALVVAGVATGISIKMSMDGTYFCELNSNLASLLPGVEVTLGCHADC